MLLSSLEAQLGKRLVPELDVEHSCARHGSVLLGVVSSVIPENGLAQSFWVNLICFLALAEPKNRVLDALCCKAQFVPQSPEKARFLLLLGFFGLVGLVLQFEFDVLHLSLLLADQALLLSRYPLLKEGLERRRADQLLFSVLHGRPH